MDEKDYLGADKVVVGKDYWVFDSRLFVDDKKTPLSITMQRATVLKKYLYKNIGEPDSCLDFVFDVRFHRDGKISKAHFLYFPELVEENQSGLYKPGRSPCYGSGRVQVRSDQSRKCNMKRKTYKIEWLDNEIRWNGPSYMLESDVINIARRLMEITQTTLGMSVCCGRKQIVNFVFHGNEFVTIKNRV